MHLLDPSRTPLSAHFRISLPKRHHFASCSLVALLEPPPFFFISHVPTRPLHSFIFVFHFLNLLLSFFFFSSYLSLSSFISLFSWTFSRTVFIQALDFYFFLFFLVEIGKHKMYRFLRIVRFAFLAGSFGHLLDPMDVENLPS